MKTNLRWREWCSLHQIYERGYTINQIQNSSYIGYLINQGFLKKAPKNPNRIVSTKEFGPYYEKHHLTAYRDYTDFLNQFDIVNPNSNYTADDIDVLIVIEANKNTIIESKQTRRSLSSQLFSDSKYIEEHPGLEKAILKLLHLDDFPGQDEKDHQYIFVVPCHTPKAIILCENLNFLRMPWDARDLHIELWYAGGNNIAKLAYIPQPRLPIYYSCDWDYDGLSIYQRIKQYIPTIILLYPVALQAAKPINTHHHSSQWKTNLLLSGLNVLDYSPTAIHLINELVTKDQWIEEESNNFTELVKLNAVV